jgi:ubiquitin carboxyl-terminal hydrolase 4/11/15
MAQEARNLSATQSTMDADEDDTNIDFHPLNPNEQEELKREALTAKKLLDAFETQFFDQNTEFFYVLSVKWFNKWKKYVGYDGYANNKDPDAKLLGQVKPGAINTDIVDESADQLKYSEPSHYANTYIVPKLQSELHYKLITEEAWNFFKGLYAGTEIKRPAYQLPDGSRRVEVQLKQVKVVIVNSSLLRSIDHGRVSELKAYKFQTCSKTPIKDVKNTLINILNSPDGKNMLEAQQNSSLNYYPSAAPAITPEYCRLWKLDPLVTLADAHKYIKEICNKTTSYDYRIPFKGNFLERDEGIAFEEANIADDDHLIIELREASKGWHFQSDEVPNLDKCEFCSKYEILKYPCSCKKVNYCCDECKQKDKKYHMMRCDRAGEDGDDEDSKLTEQPDSRWGVCGLQNLGNTCFMNSGLQSLSAIKELSEYFLSDKYKPEINETNPLGTKGKLVKKYASLIKNLYYATSPSFSPWALKHAIGQHQPMFSGYQQHDSQELISFVLDFLHEDLNRVKVKPFTSTIESDGQDDYQVGRESWINHLKRNRSVIVDLMFGQFKSQLTCPKCARISITYDPFHSIPLPIPFNKEKEIEFFFLHADNHQKPYKMSLRFPVQDHYISNLKTQVAQMLEKDAKRIYFVFLTHTTKEIVTEEAKTTTNAIRKKRKHKNLFCVEIAEEDFNMDPNTKLDIDIQMTKKSTNYFGQVTRKNTTFIRTLFFKKDYTIRQLYLVLFKWFRFLWDETYTEAERDNWLKLTDEDAFHKLFEESDKKPFVIKTVTNTRGFQECFFCNDRRCDNCDLAMSDTVTLQDIAAKIKDNDFKLELEVYFENMPDYVELARLNSCVDYNKNVKTPSSPEEAKKESSAVTIYDCFKQFMVPEQLGEDNQWYCSRCKEFQRATKKMEIYKAPPIIMIQLKRFKAANSILSKAKIGEKIDFPINNLDLTNYVLNHELPMDYDLPSFDEAPPVTAADPTATTNPAEASGMEIEEKKEETKMHIETASDDAMKIEENSSQASPKKVKQPLTGKLLYDLFAVSNHYGSLGFGHYTAYTKSWKYGKWHNCDDSSVSAEDPENVCSPFCH